MTCLLSGVKFTSTCSVERKAVSAKVSITHQSSRGYLLLWRYWAWQTGTGVGCTCDILRSQFWSARKKTTQWHLSTQTHISTSLVPILPYMVCDQALEMSKVENELLSENWCSSKWKWNFNLLPLEANVLNLCYTLLAGSVVAMETNTHTLWWSHGLLLKKKNCLSVALRP